MAFGKRGGGSRSPTYVDKNWQTGKITAVAQGILQACGLLPMPGGSGLAALANPGGAAAATVDDGLYQELGREVVAQLRAGYQQRLTSPVTGGQLLDPSEIGHLLLTGQSPGFMSSLGGAITEGLETVTGGLISTDNGGLDASALAALGQLASALA